MVTGGNIGGNINTTIAVNSAKYQPNAAKTKKGKIKRVGGEYMWRYHWITYELSCVFVGKWTNIYPKIFECTQDLLFISYWAQHMWCQPVTPKPYIIVPVLKVLRVHNNGFSHTRSVVVQTVLQTWNN